MWLLKPLAIQSYFAAIKEKVGKQVVVNPHQFKVISHSVKKTDAKDARMLARSLENDMLPEVRIKDQL